MKYKKNAHSSRIRKWLQSGGRTRTSKVKTWLKDNGHSTDAIVHLLHGDSLGNERKKFVAEFRIR